ncbi:MAG: tRNA pseudouridine(13) synthase TruD [Lysobacterales bacterium]
MNLAHAYGGPVLRGVLKTTPEDFVVEETLSFSADGQGEHDLLCIEKRGANTEWVARGLARFAGVAKVAVGFAGLKDRHAVARQHFTVQLPGRQVDWSALSLPGVRLISVARHSRKLKRGALTGNGFILGLRRIQGDRTQAEQRLQALKQGGAPNYFGVQRFGIDGGNLVLARRLFAGESLERSERSFALSAARSVIFNSVLDARVRLGNWNQVIAGDLCNLAGRRAWFGPVEVDEVLRQRCAEGDIHPTGPMWGTPPAPVAGECAAIETQVAEDWRELCAGLAAAGLESERRALRVIPTQLSWDWENVADPDDSDQTSLLRLRFALPPGAYATAFIRELIDVEGDIPVGADHID